MKKYLNYTLILIALSLIVLSGCSLPGLGDGNAKDDVKITTTETSETKIIGHMEKLLIEHETDGKIKPTLIGNLGSSIIQHNALQRGDANMSAVRYTGTELTSVLEAKPTKDPDKAMSETQRLFKKKYDEKFYHSLGFANTYAFMVTKETAKKYHLEKVSDLEKYKDELRLGMDTQWMNRSTDGRIAAYDLKILEDDRKFFPPYDGSPLANEQLIKDNPEIDKALKKLEGKISTEEMQKLNYEADGKGKEPAVIAEEYLKKHHYFEEKKGGHK